MKNFERIKVNSEKMLKNEELVTLRGGVEDGTLCLNCLDLINEYLGGAYTICGISYADGLTICKSFYPSAEHWVGQCGVNCGQS
jgi:hypothetical protein